MLLLNSNIALEHGLRDNVTNLHLGQTLIIVNSDCLFGSVDIAGINNSFKSIILQNNVLQKLLNGAHFYDSSHSYISMH